MSQNLTEKLNENISQNKNMMETIQHLNGCNSSNENKERKFSTKTINFNITNKYSHSIQNSFNNSKTDSTFSEVIKSE